MVLLADAVSNLEMVQLASVARILEMDLEEHEGSNLGWVPVAPEAQRERKNAPKPEQWRQQWQQPWQAYTFCF